MARFKELLRIEAAIKHKHTADLQWALGYCQMRLQMLPEEIMRSTGVNLKMKCAKPWRIQSSSTAEILKLRPPRIGLTGLILKALGARAS